MPPSPPSPWHLLFQAEILAQMLRVNTGLVSIDVRSNKIGERGFKAMAEALQVFTATFSKPLVKNGKILMDFSFSALDDPTRAMWCPLLGAYAYWIHVGTNLGLQATNTTLQFLDLASNKQQDFDDELAKCKDRHTPCTRNPHRRLPCT